MAVLSCDKNAATLNSNCAKSASSILPLFQRDINTFFTGNVPPLGIFCILGSAPLKRPVDVRCCNNLTCSLPSLFTWSAMPSTKLERYVSTADNLRIFFKKLSAVLSPSRLAMFSSISTFALFIVKPL